MTKIVTTDNLSHALGHFLDKDRRKSLAVDYQVLYGYSDR